MEEIIIRIRDLIDFESFFQSFTGFLIRKLYKIIEEIILRIRDLIDF